MTATPHETSHPAAPGPPARSRFSRSPRGGVVLQRRDEELLCDLFLFRALTSHQINELHFSSVQRANARLRKLYDFGMVHRHFPPLSPWGSPAVYFPAAGAVPYIAREMERRESPCDPEDVSRACRVQSAPAYLDHTLACADFYLALRRAAGQSGAAQIDLYLPESLCRHPYEVEIGGGWRRETFKPDGFVRLRGNQAGTSRLVPCFIEIDRGHVSASKFRDKLDSYRRYASSGLFAEAYAQERFRLLTVTTGPLRLSHLAALAEENVLPGEGPFDALFTTFADVESSGALGRHWIMAGSSSRRAPDEGPF